MRDLVDALNLNLNKCSIFEIDEEKLIILKSHDYIMQNKFYFYLINKLHYYEENNMIKELAYAYLMSYCHYFNTFRVKIYHFII